MSWIRNVAPWTGLIAGATAWAAVTQAALILPEADCATGVGWTAPACLAAVAVASAGAGVSFREARLAAARPPNRVRTFEARVSALGGAVFAFAMILQLLAASLVPSCAR